MIPSCRGEVLLMRIFGHDSVFPKCLQRSPSKPEGNLPFIFYTWPYNTSSLQLTALCLQSVLGVCLDRDEDDLKFQSCFKLYHAESWQNFLQTISQKTCSIRDVHTAMLEGKVGKRMEPYMHAYKCSVHSKGTPNPRHCSLNMST